MGPCPFRHGYVDCDHSRIIRLDASMGPCPFRHGYDPFCMATWHQPGTLQWGHALSGMDTTSSASNASMTLPLQWGHALSGMDTWIAVFAASSEGVLQWGHALSGMDTMMFGSNFACNSCCFNGAMPFQAWIRQAKAYSLTCSASSFNGAMPFQAWIQRSSATSPT